MDPLKVLNLKPGSSLDDVRKRYRQIARDYHPDHSPDHPRAPELFREASEAYQTIMEDPDLLSGRTNSGPGYKPYVRIDVPVTIEDFYLAKEISVQITRDIFCKKCNGSGSKTGVSGICSLCQGVGHVKSSILNLLNRDPTCPVCKGVGVPADSICQFCSGSKFESETRTRKVMLGVEDYHKKAIILKNAGNQLPDGSFGNAYIKFLIAYDDRVAIEENYFRIYKKILPVQRIVGDTDTVQIFGRSITYRIEKNSVDTYVSDVVRPGIVQQVRIIFHDTPPVLTEDTIKLYKKILSIEKLTSL